MFAMATGCSGRVRTVENELPRSGGILRACGLGRWSWLDGRVTWDEALRQLYDRPESPADYASYLECIHPDDREAVHDNIQRFMRDGRYEDIEHRIVQSDGRVRWLFARGSVVFGADGQLRGLAGFAIDITEIKEREARLTMEAETDALTGLRNRRWLSHEGPREVARCERGAAPFSLVYIDVDDFKRVNDSTGGHEAGDRFLVNIVARLQSRLRMGDVLVRVGGDELVALLPTTSLEDGVVIADRLAQTVAREPITGIWPHVSVGVSAWQPGEEFHHVQRRADREMYRVKEDRKRALDSLEFP